MMKPIAVAALTLLTCALTMAVQTQEALPVTANPVVVAVRQMEERYSKNLIGAAQEMPADKYSYKPTPEQITFAHLLMHIAQSNNSLCAGIGGEQPVAMKLGESDSKEILTKALRDSFAYCEQVLAKSDDSTLGRTATSGGSGHSLTRGAALVHLSADWADHYGAAAMYLRLNNLMPPSAKKAEGK